MIDFTSYYNLFHNKMCRFYYTSKIDRMSLKQAVPHDTSIICNNCWGNLPVSKQTVHFSYCRVVYSLPGLY